MAKRNLVVIGAGAAGLWEHAKLGILMSLQKLVDKNLVTL